MTTCPECNGTGQRDSGGVHPWGEPIHLACDCKDAEIGRQWREDSSLAKWFPLTAERLASLEAENAALKREAHTWSKAAEHYANMRGLPVSALVLCSWTIATLPRMSAGPTSATPPAAPDAAPGTPPPRPPAGP